MKQDEFTAFFEKGSKQTPNTILEALDRTRKDFTVEQQPLIQPYINLTQLLLAQDPNKPVSLNEFIDQAQSAYLIGELPNQPIQPINTADQLTHQIEATLSRSRIEQLPSDSDKILALVLRKTYQKIRHYVFDLPPQNQNLDTFMGTMFSLIEAGTDLQNLTRLFSARTNSSIPNWQSDLDSFFKPQA